MTALVRAQLDRLWHTRSTAAMIALAVLVVAGAAALELAAQAPDTAAEARYALSWMGSGGLVTLLLGVLVGGAGFRHRTIITASLVTPRRGRLVLAEAAAVALLGLVTGTLAVVVTVAEVYGWIAVSGASGGLDGGSLVRPAVGALAYTTLSALVGYGLAVLTRSQIAAAVAILVVLAAVEPGLAGAVPAAGRFGPTALGIAITGESGDGGGPYQQLLPGWAAALLYGAAAATLIAGAVARTARRDVP
jgi:ABC-2 type transport system permease protein